MYVNCICINYQYMYINLPTPKNFLYQKKIRNRYAVMRTDIIDRIIFIFLNIF